MSTRPTHPSKAPMTRSAEDKRDRSSRETAETFLRERLAGGPVPQREVKADAEGAGLAWATVRRAKDRLGVVAQRESHGRDGAGRWTWAMSIPARCSTPEVSTLQRTRRKHPSVSRPPTAPTSPTIPIAVPTVTSPAPRLILCIMGAGGPASPKGTGYMPAVSPRCRRKDGAGGATHRR